LIPSVSVPAPAPELGDTVSHELPDVADQVRVPPPAFIMLTACDAGVLPPKVKEKLAWLAESASEGCGAGLTVSTTEIVCGLLVAPEALKVIAPL
jgi:hypothetical protein